MPQTPEQDADDEEVMGKITELAKAVPALRPRMIRLKDPDRDIQRLNLSAIQRWYTSDGTLTVYFEGGDSAIYPDPEGKLDAALCSAFFDVTPADLY